MALNYCVPICLLRVQLKPDTVLLTTTGGWLLLKQKRKGRAHCHPRHKTQDGIDPLVNVSIAPLNGCCWSLAVRSAEPCVYVLVNIWCTIWHLVHFLISFYLCWSELWLVCTWDIAELLILGCTACCRLEGYLYLKLYTVASLLLACSYFPLLSVAHNKVWNTFCHVLKN